MGAGHGNVAQSTEHSKSTDYTAWRDQGLTFMPENEQFLMGWC